MVRLNRYITIATDISLHNESKVVTWACYIRHDGGVIKEAGEFKEYLPHTLTAETKALAIALNIAKNNVSYWHEAKLIIYNEMPHILRVYRHKKGVQTQTPIGGPIRQEVLEDYILPLLDEVKGYDLRHVKAHFIGWKQSDTPKGYYMNRWCDKASRKMMREVRKTKEAKNACV